MRPLINLSILCILPFAISFSSYDQEPSPAAAREDGKYCNARFDFCVQYPSLLLTEKKVSDNDDGIRLTSTDGKVCAEVSGAYNVGNWSLTDIYDFSFQDITADHPEEVKYISYTIGKTSYDAVFQYGNELHYYKTVLHRDNSFVTLMIAVPMNMQELLNSLKEEMSLELQAKAPKSQG